MAFPTFLKDPNATLDYIFDWEPYLTPLGDTIASVAWVLSSGLVQEAVANTSTLATIFVSGGVLGAKETVTCRITTASSPEARIDDRTIVLKITTR